MKKRFGGGSFTVQRDGVGTDQHDVFQLQTAFVPAGNAVTGGAGTQVGSDGTCVYQLAKGALTDCQP